MKIDSDMLYGACPCGSGKKFKFCCWPKYRDKLNDDMTREEIVQTVRCEEAGVYRKSVNTEAGDICEKGRQILLKCDFGKAKPYFTKARELDPELWMAWNNEAICAWEDGSVEEAYNLQRRGIEISTVRNTFGAASMAMFAHVLGRDDEAREWIDRALADKQPLGRDVVSQVCKALALFRRHRDIVDYASGSGMDGSGVVAYFKGVALANLSEFEKALAAFASVDVPVFDERASFFSENIRDDTLPYSVYDDDWPYLWSGCFAPARWFDKDIADGRDPFARYPNVAVDAIEVLVSDELRTPEEMLKLVKGRMGERMEKLRTALKELADAKIVDEGDGGLYWAPEGVTAFKDENRPPILRPMPKWRMMYTVSETGEIEDDVNTVIEKLLRPYMRRHCSIASHDEEDTLEIAVQRIRLRKGKLPADCPSITMGKYSELWDILRHGLEEYFEWQEGKTLVCEVWYDQMFGGPMLSIENPKGDIEMVTVAIPDHFGKGSL